MASQQWEAGRARWLRPASEGELRNELENVPSGWHVRLVAGNAYSSRLPLADTLASSSNVAFISLDGIGEFRVCSSTSSTLSIGPTTPLRDVIDQGHLPSSSDHLRTVANLQTAEVASLAGNIAIARQQLIPTDVGLVLSALGAALDIHMVVSGAEGEWEHVEMLVSDFLDGKGSMKEGGRWYIRSIEVPLPEPPLLFGRVANRMQNHPSLFSVGYSRGDVEKLWITGIEAVCVCAVDLPSGEDLKESLVHRLADLRVPEAEISAIVSLCTLCARNRSLRTERLSTKLLSSQKFYLQMSAAPLTEPMVNSRAYEQVLGRVRYTQDEPTPAGCLHAVPVVAPCAHLVFGDEFMAFLRETASLFGVSILFWDEENAGNVLKGSKSSKGFFGEYTLAPGRSSYAGQAIALLLHENHSTAATAARYCNDLLRRTLNELADVRLIELGNHINSIADALASGDAPCASYAAARGDADDGFMALPDWAKEYNKEMDVPRQEYWRSIATDEKYVVVGGEVNAGSQHHWYMETQAAMCEEVEAKRFVVHSSTQSSMKVQEKVAKILGNVPLSDVEVRNYCLGGGFGGKEPQSLLTATMAADACRRMRRPVRVVLDRTTDLRMIGKRHRFEATYQVAVDSQWPHRIQAMELMMHADAGCSSSVSPAVSELAMLSADNAYHIPKYRCEHRAWLTNHPSGTAMRSFGVIQTITVSETAVEHALYNAITQSPASNNETLPVAMALAREASFLEKTRKGRPHTPWAFDTRGTQQFTHYHQELLEYDHMKKVWRKLVTGENTAFRAAAAEVEEFNKHGDQDRKQGIAALPLRYGVSFTYKPMNQGGCLISVYAVDGSVLVHHGGVEMGQGIGMKVKQAVAATLGVPMGSVRIGAHSTVTAANALDTGASTGSDLNIPAAVSAAASLRDRLREMLDSLVCDKISNWHKDLSPADKKHAGVVLELFRDHKNWNERESARTKAQKIVWKEFDKWVERNFDDTDSLTRYYMLHRRSWKVPEPLAPEGDVDTSRLNAHWKAVVKLAFHNRISLVERAFEQADADGGAEIDPKGHVFYYFNYAAAWTRVEVCLLSGEVDVLRTDILYDAGQSINPAIDIGQIEGGFIQGLGNILCESVTFDEEGLVNEDDAFSSCIPDQNSMPREFNVSLFGDGGGPLPRTDHRSNASRAQPIDVSRIACSKTTGEPPLVLATTALMAVRAALIAVKNEWVPLDTPLKPAFVLKALGASVNIPQPQPRTALPASAGDASEDAIGLTAYRPMGIGVKFLLNDEPVSLDSVDPLMPLSSLLREHLNLTGTKTACGQGVCGACTVHVQKPNQRRAAIGACLMPVGQLMMDRDETDTSKMVSVWTIEAAGTDRHIMQCAKSLAHHNGSQCGFCSPGMVMKIAMALKDKDLQIPLVADDAKLLNGNLCRCTGYRPIVDSISELIQQDGNGGAPPNVDRGQDGNYAQRYSTVHLKHDNVERASSRQKKPVGAAPQRAPRRVVGMTKAKAPVPRFKAMPMSTDALQHELKYKRKPGLAHGLPGAESRMSKRVPITSDKNIMKVVQLLMDRTGGKVGKKRKLAGASLPEKKMAKHG